MAISNLNSVDALAAADQFAISSTSSGNDVRVAASALLTYIQNNITFPDADFTTQYAAPSATAFSISITDGSDSIWLILTPTAGFAAGTIILPAMTSAADGQEVMINCTQAVTALTIDGNGATAVTGEPTALAANDFFTLRYDLPTKVWYRVK